MSGNQITYGTCVLTSLSFEDAAPRVRELLKVEGFGVLTEIDVNVVVSVHEGTTRISAVDAGAMLGIVGKPGLSKIAKEVDVRLHRVLARITAE